MNNNTQTAFVYFDDRGMPYFDFSKIIPMPKVHPLRQKKSSFSQVEDPATSYATEDKQTERDK